MPRRQVRHMITNRLNMLHSSLLNRITYIPYLKARNDRELIISYQYEAPNGIRIWFFPEPGIESSVAYCVIL